MYKNIKENIFVDRYKKSNIVKNGTSFLKEIKEFKSYIIEFYNNRIIKPKINFSNYIMGSEIY